MGQNNVIFQVYLQKAMSWTKSELKTIHAANGETRDPDLARLFDSHQKDVQVRLHMLEHSIEGKNLVEAGGVDVKFVSEPALMPDVEAATPHEKALGFISNIHQNEQLQMGLTLGLVEMARKSGDLDGEARLLDALNMIMRDLDELQHFTPVLARSAYASSDLTGNEEVITEGWESSFDELRATQQRKRSRNDLLVSYLKNAFAAETRIADAVETMAKSTEDAIHLNFLLAVRELLLQKLERLKTLLRRHGADLPAVESTPITSSDMLNDALNLLTTGHMQMATYATLISLARAFPNEYSTNLLMENLSGTIRVVEKTYSGLPHALGEAFTGLPTWRAA